MQDEMVPLTADGPTEVPLPNAPLKRVISQVRFPPILSILKEDTVAQFQELLRSEYPHLQKDNFNNVEIGQGRSPNVSTSIVWRLADESQSSKWRISLGTDFVALETSEYRNRDDFLDRLATVLASVETCFSPAEAQRLGLRYIDRIEDEAVLKIGTLIRSGVLGILQPSSELSDTLRKATSHFVTQAQFEAQEGAIQGRWGSLPPNATYDPDLLQPTSGASWVLDLDMFSKQALPFVADDLVEMTRSFAKRIYSVFRLMITDEFLTFYGGTP